MKSALCAAIPRIASGLSTEVSAQATRPAPVKLVAFPMDEERPARSRDDCVGAGLRDDVIAGPILMPVYVYVPLKHETLLDLGVIMLGAGSCRFHAEQTNTLAGGRVEESFVYFAAYLAGRGGRLGCC